MSVRRLDHVGLVVEDLPAAIAFFVELGLELEGQASVEGSWADRLLALEGVRTDIAMMRTPDGASRVELSVFRAPAAGAANAAPVTSPGIPRMTFVVDDLDDTLGRLRPHGVSLHGEVVRYEDYCRYAYVRGPAGVLLGIVEELS